MPPHPIPPINAEFRTGEELKFAPLRDAFASILDQDAELGGAVAVYAHGELIADLWGGIPMSGVSTLGNVTRWSAPFLPAKPRPGFVCCT